MSSPIVTSDDESISFEKDLVLLSEDEDFNRVPEEIVISSDEELPSVELKQKKSAAIRNLFESNNGTKEWAGAGRNKRIPERPEVSKNNMKSYFAPSTSRVKKVAEKVTNVEIPKVPGVNRMIEGVNINLPVTPYGCQVALMSMLIKAIKRNQNCLLESPTGSGKTLALLCGALAWVSQEKQKVADMEAQQYFSDHPHLNEIEGAKEYVTSPHKNAKEMFNRNNFGEKSIYDKPADGAIDLQQFAYEEKPGLVKIHKRKRQDSTETEVGDTKSLTPEKKNKLSSWSTNTEEKSVTPEKYNKPVNSSPERIRYLIENLRIRTSMCVNCSVPTIYYGARTHKQLEQVIKEFGRTSYCGRLTMTVLSSRDRSCVREFDQQLWKNKNDMCKECTKKKGKSGVSNCQYYDGRMRLNHGRLPPAFDLEDLVRAGHELKACPYFAAREMAANADIVFCPYNYLIEPSIRSSMRIDLQDNIVIIDEAHNIEDICRDAATFTFRSDEILTALAEFEHVAKYRYENQDSMTHIDYLIKYMKNWDYWFTNQTRLLTKLPVNENGAEHRWEAHQLIKTLDNHNIGYKDYSEFKEHVQQLCAMLRDNPDSLLGVSTATGTLVEAINSALGYLFREECKFADDFTPLLIRNVVGDTNKPTNWRSSQFRKSIESETISLQLLCMNPAVVFESLKVARCIVLASGTLTPMISLHSELGAQFPLKISPSHVIPQDRVWIGTLTHHNGRPLECKSRFTSQTETQDSIGEVIQYVCSVTPHGVLCFLPSYHLLNTLVRRWRETGVWNQLNRLKNVLQESRNVQDHNDIMEEYYNSCEVNERGGLLFAVYRGKVSEGMDFRDQQARAVITIGIPYPNVGDKAVKAKMEYNNKYEKERNLLTGQDWIKVQAYRALNQAVGRCVRHRADWGAVLMVDARFQDKEYTKHLSSWVVKFLDKNQHTFQSLKSDPNSLGSFMQNMTITDEENDCK